MTARDRRDFPALPALPALLLWLAPGLAGATDASAGPRADANAAPTMDASTEITPDPTAPELETEAGLSLGLTSNLQRARRGGQADGLVDAEGEVFAIALKQRLSGSVGFGLRQPLGLPELRNAQARVAGTYEAPAGPLQLGAALAGEYERSLTVFTETGTLGAALSRSSMGARVSPYVAWAPEPFRVDLAPMAGVRHVTGAEQYDLSDLGARVSFRWFDTPLFHAGAAVMWHARRFDGLYSRTRDGLQPTVAPPVSLNLLDTEVVLGSHPREDLDLALRLGLSRIYDRFDGYHGHVGMDAGLEGTWQPERGLGANAALEFSRRTYGLRLTTAKQSGDESELDVRSGVHYAWRRWCVPSADYEFHFAEAGGVGTLYTEHVGLLGLRGRY